MTLFPQLIYDIFSYLLYDLFLSLTYDLYSQMSYDLFLQGRFPESPLMNSVPITVTKLTHLTTSSRAFPSTSGSYFSVPILNTTMDRFLEGSWVLKPNVRWARVKSGVPSWKRIGSTIAKSNKMMRRPISSRSRSLTTGTELTTKLTTEKKSTTDRKNVIVSCQERVD